ncbi:protein RarD [Aphanomyces invadans]|uniref:Protein RarD n=1 Tax=Aphanomyces invadans TaxID=157072 RepID=A0A024TBT5_9STRA|nr:protein RarD [Aphanomyces invadans]ETV91444.1 protein RarD [Aphanomyces invadans]|eukprot:XP_008879896.1 protein RarD [Aphanomyces invadans]
MIKPNPRKGVVFCVATNLIWSVCPIYWKQLLHVPYLQLLCHRIVWALPTLLVYLTISGQIYVFASNVRIWKVVLRYAGSGILLGATLFLTVWAVNSGHIVEMSLAFFINPLMNVLLGVAFLREKLRRYQWVAVALATTGVLIIAISYGQVPWIALIIALIFGVYGLVKKIAPLDPVHGVTIELTLLSVPSMVYLATCDNVFAHNSATTDLLLVGAGIFPTAIPYVLFSASAQHISMTLLGILQYIQPIGHFFIGVFMYDEPFSTVKLIGFLIVWAALVVFTVEGVVRHRQNKSLPPLAPTEGMAHIEVLTPQSCPTSPNNETSV